MKLSTEIPQSPEGLPFLGHAVPHGPRSVAPITVPRLHCPFPPSPPNHELWLEGVEEDCIAWAKRFGLLVGPAKEEQMRGARFAWLTGMAYPDGIPERITLACQWTYWLAAVDDYWFDTPQIEGVALVTSQSVLRARSIIEDPDRSIDESDPYSSCLQDLCRRTRKVAAPSQYVRLKFTLAEYLMSGLCQLNFVLTDYSPSLPEYPELREYTGVGYVFLSFVDMVRGFELPSQIWCRPQVQELNRMATHILDYAHDIRGFHKEASHTSDRTVNLPMLLAKRHGRPVQRGLELAVEVYDAELARFVEIAGRLRRGSDDARLRRYIVGVEAWLRGHNDWYDVSTRYQPGADVDIWAPPHARAGDRVLAAATTSR